ncbi:MAG: hypothetical protein HN584_06185 [Akkermansiaceae bacterium]|jgi:hypothetical protein|nr:hypothetical protein [Akkermansiaceae bacterium]
MVKHALITLLIFLVIRLHAANAQAPVIESVKINPTTVVNGGEVKVTLRVRSNVPINFLQKDFVGPSLTLYEGGAATSFTKEVDGSDIWTYEWTDDISFLMPSGDYKYKNIRVRNVSGLNSDYWPDVTFTVDNSAVPEISGEFIGDYASWVMVNDGEGYGVFRASEVPFFTFEVTGDFVPSQTFIQDTDLFNYAPFEDLYGEADTAKNLRVQTLATPEAATNISTSIVQIVFSDIVKAGSIGFAVTDLDLDDVVIKASYKGVPVGRAIVNRWLKGLFDSKPNNGDANDLPHWDPEKMP